jgi:hypothetical protein
MKPHYYLMQDKKILRLEEEMNFDELSNAIKAFRFEEEKVVLNQEQANWRVAIFRDEIMELDEYTDYLSSASSVA